jgi:cell division transport system ATP-binding protein
MSDKSVLRLEKANIFQGQNLILKDITLNIDKGEFVYLIGKTGSGKSSLLKTLYGEITLTDGTGFIGGFELNKIKARKIPLLRRKLGIVFQDFQLLGDRTVTENLLFVMKATGWKDKKKMEATVKETLDKVHMGSKGYKMPHELSGGEQQRAAIARALVNDPEIIIADEPTGNLDPETSEKIMQLLVEIKNQGKSVLMATHDLSLINKFPGRTLICENSSISETNKATITV